LLDETVRRKGISFLKEMITAVHEMGGGMIGGTVHSYWSGVLPTELDVKEPLWRQRLKSMRELTPLAEELGVTRNVEVINRKSPGTGRMPWKEIKQVLDDIGFDGSLIMEPFVMRGGQVGRDIVVWREMIPNPDLDALAAASAEFVKWNLR